MTTKEKKIYLPLTIMSEKKKKMISKLKESYCA